MHNLPSDATKRLRWPLRLTFLGLISEAVLRAFWPLIILVLTAGAALASGLVAALPPIWGFGLLAALGAAMLAAFIIGARRLSLPNRVDALTRLDATLPGQPITVLCDDQVIGAGDAASRKIWQVHRTRMAAALKGVRATPPDLRLSTRDPYALRYSALLAFVMALSFGALFETADLGDILPQFTAKATVPASWEGWITPPTYTGKPSLYLNDQPPGPLAVPQGSHMIMRFYGRLGDLTLSETVSGIPPAAADAPPQPGYSFDVLHDGSLTINGQNGASWQLNATPDAPPDFTSIGEMTRTLAGDLQQGFSASDDYGVASGHAVLTLDLDAVKRQYGLSVEPEARDALTLDLPMPFRGDRKSVDEVLFKNFATHPWAELPVVLTMSVTDEAGQDGFSTHIALTLPGRRFLDPLAMALIEQRRDLLWSRDNAPRIASLLRALSNRPDGFLEREVTYLMLRLLARRLESGARFDLSDEARDEVAQGLWDIAVGIEDGNLGDARERLRRAQERLSEAMEQGATDEELAELMDELRQAMRDYTQQLAQQSPQDGDSQQAENGEGQEISPEDLEAMMDAIEEAMEQGRQEEAQAMLDALQEMMENMRVTEGQPGQNGDRPGDQAMQGLADSLSRQQGLSDEAFRDLQEQEGSGDMAGESEGNTGRDGGKGRGQSHSGEGGDGQGDGADGDLSDRQQQLAEELERQRNNLPGAGSESGDAARDALDEAGRAMEDAAEGLAEGDLSGALDKQAEAMEALRESMRRLDDTLAEAERNREGRQGANDGRSGSNRPNDPLGRGPNSRGGVATEAPLRGGEDVYRRAEELMQELRRRSGDRSRPDIERDYLFRLLDQF